MMPQFVDMTSLFNYWSKLHANNITGSGVMTIFVGKELTRSSKFGNTPVWSVFCPISGDWDKLGIPSWPRMSVTKSYLMLQNAKVTAFTASELLRENQLPLPIRRGLMIMFCQLN